MKIMVAVKRVVDYAVKIRVKPDKVLLLYLFYIYLIHQLHRHHLLLLLLMI